MKTHIIIFIVVWIFIPFILEAQDYVEDSKKINQIKSNSDYVYADEYGETRAEAEELADIMLEVEINRIVMVKEIGSLLMEKMKENLGNHVHTIEVRQDNMFRIFKYISSKELFSADTAQIISTEKSTSTVQQATDEDTETELTEELSTIEDAEEPPVVQDTITIQPVITSSERTGNALLDKILNLTTVDKLEVFLKNEKEEGALMYGRMGTLSNTENAYLIIISQAGDVEAILGRGTTVRHNYLTGNQNDSLSNYPNKIVVWILIY